jgi:hypothetical protein
MKVLRFSQQCWPRFKSYWTFRWIIVPSISGSDSSWSVLTLNVRHYALPKRLQPVEKAQCSKTLESLRLSDVSIFCIVCHKLIFIRRTIVKRAKEVYCELNVKLSSTEATRIHLFRKNCDLPTYTSITILHWNLFSNIWGETSKKTLSLKRTYINKEVQCSHTRRGRSKINMAI